MLTCASEYYFRRKFGTVFVQKVTKVDETQNKPCPCLACRSEQIRTWAYVEVSTNLHVVQHQKFAQTCVVRLFFDRDTPEDVANEKILHGLELHSVNQVGDWCALSCVTHDLELIKDLEDWITQHYKLGDSLRQTYGNPDNNNKLIIIVSHPHGGPKMISIGKVLDKRIEIEVRDDQDWCSYYYDAATCSGSSGALVYVLGRWRKGYGYWFGHPHNHKGVQKKDTRRGHSSIGAEIKV